MQTSILLLLLSLLAVAQATAVTTQEDSSQFPGLSSVTRKFCLTSQGPFNRPVGESCHCPNQCASKSCKKDVCTCRRNVHCPHGHTCIRKLFKQNVCGLVGLPLGSYCSRNKQCASAKCQGKRCVCSDDGDCADGQKCKRKLFKPNKCEGSGATSVPLGGACGKNKECASRKCSRKQCVCNDNGDCPAGQICMKPLFSKNNCVAAGRPLGTKCRRNKQCASKRCKKKRCVCNDNGDCPFGQVCKKKLFKKNECK